MPGWRRVHQGKISALKPKTMRKWCAEIEGGMRGNSIKDSLFQSEGGNTAFDSRLGEFRKGINHAINLLDGTRAENPVLWGVVAIEA